MKDHELLCILIIAIIIIFILSNTNNQPDAKQELKENFIEQPELKATFYEGCNYQGKSFELGPGWEIPTKKYADREEYLPSRISNTVNSIRIPDGLTVTLEGVKKIVINNVQNSDRLTFNKSVDCIRDLPFNYWKDYEDKITRILVEKNLPGNFNTIKSGYIEKDYNISQTPESDYMFTDYNQRGRRYNYIIDTLENCKKKCDSSGGAWEGCRAFTRQKRTPDTSVDACYFKQDHALYPTRNIDLIKIPNDPGWKTYVKYQGSFEENEDKAAAEKAEADARGITIEALRNEKVVKAVAQLDAANKNERYNSMNWYQKQQYNRLQQQLKDSQDQWDKYMR